MLLISVDGLHALDLSNFVATHPDSTLAELSRHGVTYSNNSTSSPSDSFPGLASLVTGGSPVTTGLWYDDTYNRALSPGGGLNPKFLVRNPNNGCKTILPHEYLRVNTIFEVVKAGGGRTASADARHDVHTALLLSLPSLEHAVVKSAVSNQQVAPTIVKALGLDPNDLDAVRKEQIAPLPFLFKGKFDNRASEF